MFEVFLRAIGTKPAADHDTLPLYIQLVLEGGTLGAILDYDPKTLSYIERDVIGDREPIKISGWQLTEFLDEPDVYTDYYVPSREGAEGRHSAPALRDWHNAAAAGSA